MPAYYARVCWNEDGWRFPSGRTRHEAGYAGKNGFGHEEWLFNFAWILDDFHYSFLQPVNKALSSRRGELLDLVLWAIRPEDRVRVKVGTIQNCEVLTAEESRRAFRFHKKMGWFKQMEEDVFRVGGKTQEFDYEGLFNIRFRREDAIIFDSPIPFKPAPKKLAKGRYQLMAVSDSEARQIVESEACTGTTTLPPHPPTHPARAGSKSVIVDPQHTRLQRRLMQLLQEHYGEENVRREGGWKSARVDLAVKDGERQLLIEIKPYPNAQQVLREALGQILEYAYFDLSKADSTQNIELFIVAPAVQDQRAIRYLNLLQSRFRLPIKYCSFSLHDSIPEALKKAPS